VRTIQKSDVLVVCIGNDLVGDDGAGRAVYNELQKQSLPNSIQVVHLGLGGMALFDYLHGQRLLILVDAVQINGSPGDIHVLDWDHLPTQQGQAVSLHGIGLCDTINIMRTLYPELVPEQTALIGIEGRIFNELGAPLSKEVAASIPTAMEHVLQLISQVQTRHENPFTIAKSAMIHEPEVAHGSTYEPIPY